MLKNGVLRFVVWLFYMMIARKLPCSTSAVGGNIFRSVRYRCAKLLFLECGSNVNIESGVSLGYRTRIVIGEYSGIGVNCLVPNDINIGKHVMMGPNVVFITQNHLFSDTETPMMYQGLSKKTSFVVEDDVWLGRNVIVLPKAERIGRGSIISCAAVVTKNVEPYSIVAGIPAKVIGCRK